MSTLLAIGLANALAAAALAVLAFLVSRWGRRPALAHALWLLVLLKLVTPPLFRIDLPWLPAEVAPEPGIVETPTPAPVVVQQFPALVEQFILDTAGTAPPAQLIDTSLPLVAPPVGPPAEIRPLPAVEPVIEEGNKPIPESYPGNPLPLLLIVWGLGSLFVLGRAALNVWRFHCLLRNARLAPEYIQTQAAELARRMGLRSCPAIYLVPGPLPPMVWAVGRVRVLFPEGLLARLDAEARASLLAHELAHIRRMDHWVRWLELLVLSLYWWYPLAWVARRQLQAREEECCDAWASQQVEPRVYATAILDAVDFLSEARPRVPSVASPLGSARSLRERLTLIMTSSSPRRLTWLGRLALLVIALATLPLLPSLTRRAESADVAQQQEVVKKVDDAKQEVSESEPTLFDLAVNLNQGSDEVYGLAVSPDGNQVAAGFGDSRRPGMVEVWDLVTRKSLLRFDDARGISSVGFSPDSKRLAWAGWGGRVQMELFPTRKPLYRLSLPGNSNTRNHRIAHSGDGKWLAVAGEDRSLRLLDAMTGRVSRLLLDEPTSYYCVAFSPKSDLLAAGGGSFQDNGSGGPNHVNLYAVKSGKWVGKLTGHTRAVLNVAFAPKEKLIATASADRTVRVWDGKTFKIQVVLKGHTDAVKGLSFSPDGKTLATGSWDSTIRLWNPSDGKELARLEGNPGAVREVAFTPNGKYLISGGARSAVKVWDIKRLKEAFILRQEESALPTPRPSRVFAASGDGKFLATGGEDGAVSLLDAVSGRLLRRLKGHEDAVTALCFSRDGKYVASSGPDAVVMVWGTSDGKLVRKFSGHTNWVYSLCFSPDGKRLASGSYDRSIRLWNLEKEGKEVVLTGHKASVRGLNFSPDGKSLASAGSDHRVCLWDVAAGKCLATLKGHTAAVRGVLFDRQGKHVFSVGEDGLLKRWSVKEEKEVASVSAHSREALCLALSPRGEVLLTGGQDGTIKTWSARTLTLWSQRQTNRDSVLGLGFAPDGRRFYSLAANVVSAWDAVPGPVRFFEGHTGPVRVATFSPDGKYLLSCGGWPEGDRTLRLWNVQTGTQTRLLTKDKTSLLSAAFSPDGKYALAGSDSGMIGMWEVPSGREVGKVQAHQGPIPHMTFSADGKWLLTSSHDKTVRLWNMSKGLPKTAERTFTSHTDWARCAVFMADGKHILTGGRDRTLRQWDVNSGKLLKTIEHEKEWVESIAVLPDGKRLLTGGGNAMRLWDLESGKLLRRYAPHAYGVTCVALAKDGKTALSASYDGSTRLWDVESGAELRRFRSHREWVWSVAISPDGKTFATAGGGGQRNNQFIAGEDFAIRLWRMPQPEGSQPVLRATRVRDMDFFLKIAE